MGEAPLEGGREEAGRAFRSQSRAAPGSGRGREEVGGRSPWAKADRQRGPHGNGSTLASMYPRVLSLGCEWPKGSMALAQCGGGSTGWPLKPRVSSVPRSGES